MADDFNPYHEFLGLPATAAAPDHYVLLGLDASVADPAQVQRAAQQRKSRIRSCRPGEHAAQWRQLLDEIDAARNCLSDPQQRAAYDQQLNHSAALDRSLLDPEPPSVALQPALVQNLMPPGWPVRGSTGTQAAPEEATPAYPGDREPTPGSTDEKPDPPSQPTLAGASLRGGGTAQIAPMSSAVPAAREDGAPIMQIGSTAFVVPTGVATGPAASLLPPAAGAPIGHASAVAAGAMLQSPPSVPMGMGAPLAMPLLVRSASKAADTPTENDPMPVKEPQPLPDVSLPIEVPAKSSAALVSIVGLCGAILLLCGAIVWAWMARSQHPEIATSGNPSTPSAAPESPATKPGPAPHQPTPNPAPTPSPPDGTPTTPVEPKPEPKPEPTPSPKPVPKPKPKPVPQPEPKPEPQPEPPAAASPEQIQKVQEALRRVRQALAQRDMQGAAAAIKEAQSAAGDGALAESVRPTEALANGVTQFWAAVGSALPKLAGSELEVGDTRIFVIDSGPDRIFIRWAGSNREFSHKTLPAGLARKIAEDWLEQSATSKMIVGSFLAVDPTMVASKGREKRRKLWAEAAASGSNVSELLAALKELDP